METRYVWAMGHKPGLTEFAIKIGPPVLGAPNSVGMQRGVFIIC